MTPKIVAPDAQPELSIILPCYRAASLAGDSVNRLVGFLNETAESWEIIVVDDGGGDFGDWSHPDWRVRLIRVPVNRGKGAALREGMLAARGRARIFTDVDLPFELDLIPVIANYIATGGFHVVVGDRTLPGSSYLLDVGWKRRLASQAFSFFVGKLVTGGFFDTQCGLKGFRGDVADQIFRLAQVDRFACDVELIYLSLIYRLDIKRVPVQLRRNETSSIRLVRDSILMLGDVFRMKYLRIRGAYQNARLERLLFDDFAERRRLVLDQRMVASPEETRA
jgi:dolichyl-phosphate beta-glucosyltransferase